MKTNCYSEAKQARVELNLSVGEIENAIATHGWTILNDAQMTAEDRAEVARIEAQGFARLAA